MNCFFYILFCCFFLIVPYEGIGSEHHTGKGNIAVFRISDHAYRILFYSPESDRESLLRENNFLSGIEHNKRLIESSDVQNEQYVNSEDIRIELKDYPLSVQFKTDRGNLIQSLTFDTEKSELLFKTGESLLSGLGAGKNGIDRRNNYHTMQAGQLKDEYALFGASVPIPFVLSLDKWGIYVNQPLNCDFDLRDSVGNIVFKEDINVIDIVLFVGNDIKSILREFSALKGGLLLPPKWALGYMQGHRTITEPDEITRIARTFREKKLPCDALIYLGTGFSPSGWNLGHGSFEFNKGFFDKPDSIISCLRDWNFQPVLHITAPPKKLYGSMTDKDICLDDSAHVKNYWARHAHLLERGITGFWPDEGDNLSPQSKLARHRMYYEGPLSQFGNRRPFSLHRTGYAGMEKYGGWVWSGDVFSTWESLEQQVANGLSFSISGSPFWGSDIGGFNPTSQLTSELYLRWFQFGCFSPSFRAHGRTWQLRLPWGWNMGDPGVLEMDADIFGRGSPIEENFNNPLVEEICRIYLNLRYQLLPYNYSMTWHTVNTGIPMMRPMWLEFPDDKMCHEIEDQYMWGSDLLIAPVTQQGVFSRQVYVPEGTWYDFWTNRKYPGKQKLSVFSGIGRIPVFVKSGSIIPFDPVRQYANEDVAEMMTLKIYSGDDGTFLYYDDDGVSYDYLDGEYEMINFQWKDSQNLLIVETNDLKENNENPCTNIRVVIYPEMLEEVICIENGIQQYILN